MKKTICPVMMVVILPLVASANINTVFNDTFGNGSTVQNAVPADPTANSTGYEVFQQGTTPSATIASGNLHLQGRNTASAVTEVQALFTTTPVALVTVGDYIDVTVVFTNTQNILAGAIASSLNIGLYNAGGVKPNLGARLDAAGTGTGGSQNWSGYVGRIFGDGNARIFTRAPQGPGLTNPNQNQDLLFNGVSSSSTYNNPAGVVVGSALTTFTSGLTSGSTYTANLRITLSATDTLTISNALYSGSSVNVGSTLFNHAATTTVASYLTNAFDALAFGWRYNSTAAPNSIDISQIIVTESLGSGSSFPPFYITAIQPLPLNGVKLTWDSVSGTNYQIQSTDSLNPISWATNGTVTAASVSTSFTNSPISGSVTQRYYRVVATP